MKKSLLLGAAAMAALSFVPQSEAAEVKVGGYYQMRATNADTSLTDVAGVDDQNDMTQRIELNIDGKISDKTSAHFKWRPVGGSDVVQGANTGDIGGVGTDSDIKQIWAETELYGVGVKVGSLPLSINDKFLFNDDDGSFGAVVVSKSFGDMTLVGLDVRVSEGVSGGTTTSNSDDVDVYGLSLLGKAASVNYQLTWAHAEQGSAIGNAANLAAYNGAYNTVVNAAYTAGYNAYVPVAGDTVGATTTAAVAAGNAASAAAVAAAVVAGNAASAVVPSGSADDDWLALTVGTDLGGISLTGTLIWELGLDMTGLSAGMAHDSGALVALRAKGKTGFGAWNGYGLYASEDFTHPMSLTGGGINNESLSPTWRQGGPSGMTLMRNWANQSQNSGGNNDQLQNLWTIGAGLTVDAGGWAINPNIDYASIVEDAGLVSDSAWGGSLIATTNLDEGTTFSLIGVYVDPSDDDGGAANGVANMHALQAELKVKF